MLCSATRVKVVYLEYCLHIEPSDMSVIQVAYTAALQVTPSSSTFCDCCLNISLSVYTHTSFILHGVDANLRLLH